MVYLVLCVGGRGMLRIIAQRIVVVCVARCVSVVLLLFFFELYIFALVFSEYFS